MFKVTDPFINYTEKTTLYTYMYKDYIQFICYRVRRIQYKPRVKGQTQLNCDWLLINM